MTMTMEMRKRVLGLNGVFGVHKPAGETSARTVERVKAYLLSLLSDGDVMLPFREYQTLKRSLKVGHGGTLDPLATGVLVIGLGAGCKRLHTFLQGTTKTYRTVGQFGQEFDTYDRTGVVQEILPFEHIKEDQVRQALQNTFTGKIMQRPPIFSALHVNGERAYDIARKRQKEQLQRLEAEKQIRLAGDKTTDEKTPDEKKTDHGSVVPEEGSDVLQMAARLVQIDRLELLRFALPEFELQIECGSGTYVRSLIHDLGRALHSAAAMFELVRTTQGAVTLDACLAVEEMQLGDVTALEKIESAISLYPEQ